MLKWTRERGNGYKKKGTQRESEIKKKGRNDGQGDREVEGRVGHK